MRNTAVRCIACGERFDLGPKPRKGQYVDCPGCDALLEVVSLSPLKLDWLEDDFDYDDEYDDYDDDRAIFDDDDFNYDNYDDE